MDVYRLLSDRLRADVCPAYTARDAAVDEVALAVALGLRPAGPGRRGADVQRYYHQQLAADALLIAEGEWQALLREVPHRGATGSSGRPCLDGRALRLAVLARHGGDVAAWLGAGVGGGCSEAFARAVLPLPDDRRLPLEALRAAWAEVRPYFLSSAQLAAAIVRRYRARLLGPDWWWHVRLLAEDCLDALGSARDRYDALVRACELEEEGRVAAALRSRLGALGAAAMGRARWLGALLRFADEDPALAERALGVVLEGGDGSPDMTDLEGALRGARHAGLERRAAALGISPGRYRNTDLLEEAVWMAEEGRAVLAGYARLGMTALAFSHEFFDECRVRHDAHGTTTDDLWPLLELVDGSVEFVRGAFYDPERLAEMFDRHAELADALADGGAQLRGDSHLCAEYVVLGRYNGPEAGWRGDESAVAKVAAVAEELDFLFEETEYAAFAMAAHGLAQAEDLAVRGFLHPDGDCGGAPAAAAAGFGDRLGRVPARLRRAMGRRLEEPLTPWERGLLNQK
jgi:hypothetical protein